MTAGTIETVRELAPASAPTAGRGPGAPARRLRSPRPGRGRGRAGVPQLRPAVRLPAPALDRAQPARAAACHQSAADAGWRLTERGLALVLVTGMMIVAAALCVIGLTALRVTSDGYQPYGVGQLSHR
jgi:hypothetical protein